MSKHSYPRYPESVLPNCQTRDIRKLFYLVGIDILVLSSESICNKYPLTVSIAMSVSLMKAIPPRAAALSGRIVFWANIWLDGKLKIAEVILNLFTQRFSTPGSNYEISCVTKLRTSIT